MIKATNWGNNKKLTLPDVLLDLVVVEIWWHQQLVQLDHVVDVELLSLGQVAGVQLLLGVLSQAFGVSQAFKYLKERRKYNKIRPNIQFRLIFRIRTKFKSSILSFETNL